MPQCGGAAAQGSAALEPSGSLGSTRGNGLLRHSQAGRSDYCTDDVEHYFNYMGCLAVEGTYDRMEAMLQSGEERMGRDAGAAAPRRVHLSTMHCIIACKLPWVRVQGRPGRPVCTPGVDGPSRPEASPQLARKSPHPTHAPVPVAGIEPVDVLLLMAAAENDSPKIEELLGAGGGRAAAGGQA